MLNRRRIGLPAVLSLPGALLTGRYPHLSVPGHEYALPPDQPTIANVFKAAGYHTSYTGKWHLGGFKEKDGRAAFHIIPPEQRGGFDSWIGYENNNSQWDCWVHGGEGAEAFHYRLPGYETDDLSDLFIAQLQRYAQAKQAGSDQPFFAVLSVQPPHNPYVAPEAWMKAHTPGQVRLRPNVPEIARITERARRELAGYYAQIENLDWNVGRILGALADFDLSEDTHVIFFSDHGDMHGSHGQFLKTSPWEESVRVPFIIYGRETAYSQHTGSLPLLVNHVDIAPTTLGLCGIPIPDVDAGNRLFQLTACTDGLPPANPTRHTCRSSCPPGTITASTAPGAAWSPRMAGNMWRWKDSPGCYST